MNNQGWLCAICGRTQASNFCNCRSEGATFLCKECVGVHHNQDPDRAHNILPTFAYGQHSIPGYFERLTVRQANFPLGAAELRGNLAEVDACIAKFRSQIQTIVKTVLEYEETTVNTLKHLRVKLAKDINLVIKEVDSTLTQDSPDLKSELSLDLRNLRPNGYSLKLFSYSVDECPFPSSLGKVLNFSYGFTTGERVLPILTHDSLILHNLFGDQRRTIPVQNTPMCLSESICEMNARTVICLSQSSPHDGTVFSLDLSTAEFTQLQSMSIGRQFPGVLKHMNFIYVFGGGNRYLTQGLRSCEQFNMQTNSWTCLPNMLSAKYRFTPCFYADQIYLPCVSLPLLEDARSYLFNQLEVFNVKTEQFKALPITLPSFVGGSVSFIVDGELMILTGSQIGRCRLETETTFQVADVMGTLRDIGGCAAPVRIGREMYWSGSDIFYRFDVAANTIVRTKIA